ncbi:MAG: substrate-binding domain-containing protein, partial [Arthrobacter sp.]|nr:substrate-binding domain-containing protein [Arthrobacter sp.]
IDTVGDRGLETPAVKALLQRNIEGLIVATDYHSTVSLPRVPRHLPVVVLDGTPGPEERAADWVVPDEAGGAAAATRHLLEAGHRRIAMCNLADERYVARRLRREGYETALRAAGLTPDPELHVEAADLTAEAAREAAMSLLLRPDRPTAVFCFSDKLAFGIYQTAAQLGLRIPEDLSVIGFDNQPFLAESVLPPLTTVQLPHEPMGDWAVRQLIRRISDGADAPTAHHLAPCPLIIRESVAPPH